MTDHITPALYELIEYCIKCIQSEVAGNVTAYVLYAFCPPAFPLISLCVFFLPDSDRHHNCTQCESFWPSSTSLMKKILWANPGVRLESAAALAAFLNPPHLLWSIAPPVSSGSESPLPAVPTSVDFTAECHKVRAQISSVLVPQSRNLFHMSWLNSVWSEAWKWTHWG